MGRERKRERNDRADPDGKSSGQDHGLHSGDGVQEIIDRGGCIMNVSDKPGALRAQMKHHEPIICFVPEGNHCGAYREDNTSATLQTKYHYGGGGDAALIMRETGNNMAGKDGNAVCEDEQGIQRPGRDGIACRYFTRQSIDIFIEGGVASALKNRDFKDFTDIIEEETMEQPKRKYVLRRLTPLECCRLQGFPDWWCDGVEGSDSAQYKLWGNGIALPCADDVLGRIAREYEREETNGRDDAVGDEEPDD